MRSRILFTLFFISALVANTIEIPSDYSTIQAGIDATSNGDTVLVAAGTYVENINYNGKNIVVGSLYLTTSDTSYISSTIIDGNESGCVVFLNSYTSSELIGFSIVNGSGVYGAVHLDSDAIATIKNLIIKDNNLTSGIISKGFLNCVNTIIKNNLTQYGAEVSRHTTTFSNCLITGNESALRNQGSGNTIIKNCTIVNNGNQSIFQYYSSGSVTINNSIFGDDYFFDGSLGGPDVIVNYSCLSEEISTDDYSGASNIDSDPLFADTANGNYSLSIYSPCIGAGTATGAPTTDIDGNARPNPSDSNPDMGAYENALGTPSAPPVPTSLAATVGNGVVNLSWTGNDYATKYYVYRSTTSGASFTKIDSTTAPTVTYSNTGLTNNTVYYFKVSAYGAGGEGSATAEVSATPVAQKYTVKTDGTGDYTVIQTAID
ncbi:MAG: choice-of-anchor Q domain-containing protein, partial [Anaerolineales bacterium]|nr:choice-of-anchor Q domain-containing protein [Anaerolineales bacterium]